jgi:hypothetical protein
MKVIKKILTDGCVLYTCLSLLLLLVNLIATLAGGDSLDRAPIPALTFFMLYPFGLAMAGAAFLRKKYARGFGRLLHYLITVLALWLFLWLPSGVTVRAATMLVLLALVSALYWATVGIVALVRGRYQRIIKGSDLS